MRHALARRDELVVAKKKDSPSEESEIVQEDMTAKVEGLRNDLKTIMRNMKLKGLGNGRQQAANYNANVTGEIVPEHNDVFAIDWTVSTTVKENVLIGERAERLDCFSSDKKEKRPWKLFRPMISGHFNLEQYTEHYGSSSALQALLNDLRLIWSHAITSPKEDDIQRQEASQIIDVGLGISAKDWPKYNVVLVIPDLYLISEVEEVVRLLLEDMGFAGILIQQEGVCATFGAGLSSGCVVHLGSDRAAISCVDEGLIIAESRMSLHYGGQDVSRFFMQLLKKANFPYKAFDIDKRLADYWLADQLKERLCTLEASQLALLINDFHVRLPKQKTKKYSLRTYDEIIIGPMALFSPRVFFNEVKKPRLSSRSNSATDDDEMEDEEVGVETVAGTSVPITIAMNLCVRHLLPAVPIITTTPAALAAPSQITQEPGTAAPSARSTPIPTPAVSGRVAELVALEPITLNGETNTLLTSGNMTPAVRDEDASLASERNSPAPMGSKANTGMNGNGKVATPSFDVPWEAGKVPLDFAVWNSIQASISNLGSAGTCEERVRRMSGNIICTGGTTLIPGLGVALEARLNNYLNQWYISQNKESHGATVVPPPREMDPRILAWKGMSVLARLDSAQEMWIPKREWQTFGVRALKEKSLFL